METAIEDDGSCDFESCYGCTDEQACNYDSDALNDDGSCDLSSHTVTISIDFDLYPLETTWTLNDEAGNVVLDGGPYAFYSSLEASMSVSACLPEGCYSFTIYDSYGDGISHGRCAVQWKPGRARTLCSWMMR